MNPSPLPDETLVHRIGGGSATNLQLAPVEAAIDPPGISLLAGGTALEAAKTMRRQFPRRAPRGRTIVGSGTVAAIRSVGFDVIMDATRRFPQHVRLIHPLGAIGFSTANLQQLSQCFHDQVGL